MKVVKKILCPYCFEGINLFEVHWRCSNVQCRMDTTSAPGEMDDLLCQYNRYFVPNAPAQRLAHAFPSPPPNFIQKQGLGSLLQTMRCDWCKKPTSRRLCPRCHNELPYTVDTVENMVIAVIGARETGKSHYIAVLVDRLQKRVGTSFNLSLMALNDTTTNRYRDEFYNPLFRQRDLLTKTQVAGVIPAPLMFRLKLTTHSPFGNKALTLIFFDTAGETFDSRDLIVQMRYLVNASAIILLVDPLQMEKVRVDVENRGGRVPNAFTEPRTVIERMVNTLRAERGIPSTKMIDTPLAVSFTKSDALCDYQIFPPGNALYSLPLHEGQFHKENCRQIHDEVQSVIADWDGGAMENILKTDFSDYSYFGLSALGESPGQNNKLNAIAPFRVEDPLLWVLTRLGYLKSSSGK